MIKIAIITFLLFSLNSNAQVILESDSSAEIIKNSLLAKFAGNYEIVDENKDDTRIYYVLRLVDTVEKYKIFIEIDRTMVGENKALEIKGRTSFKLNTILGKYLDIFNVWASFFPNADKTKLSNTNVSIKEHTIINGKDYHLQLLPSDYGKNEWGIRLLFY